MMDGYLGVGDITRAADVGCILCATIRRKWTDIKRREEKRREWESVERERCRQ
jgi:hypothetical protein